MTQIDYNHLFNRFAFWLLVIAIIIFTMSPFVYALSISFRTNPQVLIEARYLPEVANFERQYNLSRVQIVEVNDPGGPDEYIKIQNVGERTVDLEDWRIISSKKYESLPQENIYNPSLETQTYPSSQLSRSDDLDARLGGIRPQDDVSIIFTAIQRSFPPDSVAMPQQPPTRHVSGNHVLDIGQWNQINNITYAFDVIVVHFTNYQLPEVRIAPGESLLVFTGQGVDTDSEVYMGYEYRATAAQSNPSLWYGRLWGEDAIKITLSSGRVTESTYTTGSGPVERVQVVDQANIGQIGYEDFNEFFFDQIFTSDEYATTVGAFGDCCSLDYDTPRETTNYGFFVSVFGGTDLDAAFDLDTLLATPEGTADVIQALGVVNRSFDDQAAQTFIDNLASVTTLEEADALLIETGFDDEFVIEFLAGYLTVELVSEAQLSTVLATFGATNIPEGGFGDLDSPADVRAALEAYANANEGMNSEALTDFLNELENADSIAEIIAAYTVAEFDATFIESNVQQLSSENLLVFVKNEMLLGNYHDEFVDTFGGASSATIAVFEDKDSILELLEDANTLAELEAAFILFGSVDTNFNAEAAFDLVDDLSDATTADEFSAYLQAAGFPEDFYGPIVEEGSEISTEYVEIQHFGNIPVNLEGWRISNTQNPRDNYTLPPFTLQPDTVVAIVTGWGLNTEEAIFLNNDTPIWEETQVANLTDATGLVRSSYIIAGEVYALRNYTNLLEDETFLRNLWNSAIVATVSVTLSLVVGSFAAYALGRIRFRGQYLVLYLVLAMTMFPQISVLSGMYEIVKDLEIFNSNFAMIFSYPLFTLPFTVWVLTSFFQGLPSEIEQAALVDGATAFQTFWRILVPLTAPALVTTGLLAFIAAWNEYLFALTFTLGEENRTVPVAIAQFAGFDREDPTADKIAAAVVVTIPLLVLVLIFQRRIVEGLTAGAVKG